MDVKFDRFSREALTAIREDADIGMRVGKDDEIKSYWKDVFAAAENEIIKRDLEKIETEDDGIVPDPVQIAMQDQADREAEEVRDRGIHEQPNAYAD